MICVHIRVYGAEAHEVKPKHQYVIMHGNIGQVVTAGLVLLLELAVCPELPQARLQTVCASTAILMAHRKE